MTASAPHPADRSVERPDFRPSVPGSVLAVAAGVASVALLIDTPEQWQALLVEVAGIVFVAAGYATWRRRSRADGAPAGVVGGLFAVVGVLLVAAAVAVALTRPPAMIHRLELAPGLVGLAVLLAGLLPVRAGRERTLVTAGTALLFVGVLTSGVVHGATLASLLLAGVATVLAWDLGEQAVSLGAQVGRGASTYRAELVHGGGSLAAGVGVFLVALGVDRLGIRELSLTGFTALLVAGLVLVLALRQ